MSDQQITKTERKTTLLTLGLVKGAAEYRPTPCDTVRYGGPKVVYKPLRHYE